MCDKICNDCIFGTSDVVFKSDGKGYKNFYCNHDESKNVVDISVDYYQEVPAPNWCPLLNKDGVTKQTKKTNVATEDDDEEDEMTRNPWYKLKPSIEWNHIKKGEIYHIPPFMNEPRKDIEIVYKCDEYFTWKNVNGGKYLLCYKNDIMSKVMVKKI